MARETNEEILNNYEFKVLKRIVMREHPYILDMRPHETQDQYNSVVFLDLDLDFNKFMEHYDLTPLPHLTSWIGIAHPNGFTTSVPKSLFLGKADDTPSDDINKLMKKVHQSEGLPMDLKLTRSPRAGDYTFRF